MDKESIDARLGALRDALEPAIRAAHRCEQIAVLRTIEGKQVAVPVWLGTMKLPDQDALDSMELLLELGRLGAERIRKY